MKILEPIIGTAFSRAVGKRDAQRKALATAERNVADLSAKIDAEQDALRAAVAEDGGPDPDKIAARIVKLREDLRKAEELVPAYRSAVEAAEAGFLEARGRERLSRIEVAIAATEPAWLASREPVVSATLALAEARGRELALRDRLSNLYAALRKAGGEPNVILNDKSLEYVADVAEKALYAKHGDRVNRGDLPYFDRAFGYLVNGLAGPEPEIEPAEK